MQVLHCQRNAKGSEVEKLGIIRRHVPVSDQARERDDRSIDEHMQQRAVELDSFLVKRRE